MEIFEASRQWSTRPADERFPSLAAMFEACKGYARQAVEKTTQWARLRVEAVGEEVRIIGKADVAAEHGALLTHYATGQLAQRVGAPAAYIRSLPATLAAQNLNYGLANRTDGDAQLLFHSNGSLLLRAATSERYERVWNHEVVARLMDASARYGLVPAAPTFRQFDDGHGNMPALYASDHDMFAFVMSKEREIVDPMGQRLFRGVIAVNSEVGAGSLRLMGFDFREICGNHIIWGARDIAEIRLTHVGRIRDRWNNAILQVRKYMDAPGSLTEAKYRQAMVTIPGADKEAVLDAVFAQSRGKVAVTRGVLSAGYDAVVPSDDGPANTVYGLAQGLTRHSQTLGYADDRTAIDKAAGKLLEMAF